MKYDDSQYLPTEELRARAKQTDGPGRGRTADWDIWTREMLIAFFRNRPHLPQPVRHESELTERYT